MGDGSLVAMHTHLLGAVRLAGTLLALAHCRDDGLVLFAEVSCLSDKRDVACDDSLVLLGLKMRDDRLRVQRLVGWVPSEVKMKFGAEGEFTSLSNIRLQ